MNSTRAERIQSLIRDRQRHAEAVFKPIRDKLQELTSSLSKLEQYKQQLNELLEGTEDDNKIQQIYFSHYIQRIEGEIQKLDRLVERFSRSTLNLGVLGYTGQGKSTLLKSITSLSDDVIPTSSHEACTVARSVIQHHDEDKIQAKVKFHSEQSFLDEVIIPFYVELGLQPIPSSFTNWVTNPLQQSDFPSGTDKSNIYLHLDQYYKRYVGGYRNFVGRGEANINQEEIKEYVSHQYDSSGNLINPKCLAVREVVISCKFKNSDVGNIALVDIPGLGSFRIGDEQLMIETLGSSVDILLFLYKPSKDRVEWGRGSSQLYDKARKCLNNLENRIFIILNQDSSANNLENCKKAKKKVDNGEVQMPSVDRIISDCSNSKSVNDYVLERVLEYLEGGITTLDKQYAHDCMQRIKQVSSEVKAELRRARLFTDQSNEINQFSLMFEGENGRGGLMGNIIEGLGKFLDGLRLKRDEHETEFKRLTQGIIEKCKHGKKQGIPEHGDIISEIYIKGGGAARFSEYLEEMRSYISKFFVELDIDLQSFLEKTKQEVVKILKDAGRMRALAENLEGSDFLTEILKWLPDDAEGLYLGFQRLANYNVSYSGVISHRMRQKLRRLSPNMSQSIGNNQANAELVTQIRDLLYDSAGQFVFPQNQFSQIILEKLGEILDKSKAENLSDSTSFEELRVSQVDAIYNQLEKLYDFTVEKCGEELMKLSVEPNEIACSMVEEFVDYVIYSKNYKKEWISFLSSQRQKIWSKNLDAELRETWMKLLETSDQLVNQIETELS